jgi:hypothetical protein
MAIPQELQAFSSEDDFVQRFLIPLLARLGLPVVVNYHGKREAGMDLIIGEIDRFNHVRYHGIQVKYVGSIGKGDSHGLSQDAVEAFAIGFRHPQTGVQHRISTFYAVNGGSISDEARDLFFSDLSGRFGDNVRLLEGRDLVALDRSAAVGLEAKRERLAALHLEARSMLLSLGRLELLLTRIAEGDGNGVVYPIERLRLVATQGWLAQPPAIASLPLAQVEAFYMLASGFNRSVDEAGSSPLHTVASIKIPAIKALRLAPQVKSEATTIIRAIDEIVAGLGPIASL